MKTKMNLFYRAILIIGVVNGVACGGSSGSGKKKSASTTPCVNDSITQSPCVVETVGSYVSSLLQSDVTSWSNSNQSTTVTADLSMGFYSEKSCLLTDANLLSSNILYGKNIFGVTGSYTGTYSQNMNSQAHRSPGSIPIVLNGDIQNTSEVLTMTQENTNYSGQSWPTSSEYKYRDIPDVNVDDEAYLGTSCKYVVRPQVDCGTTQSTLRERIEDCAHLNGVCSDGTSTTQTVCESAQATWSTTATWDGSTQCNGGQGVWKLVTRSASNKEVWQDQRTGLLWSSLVSTSANWCQASGNTEFPPVTYHQSCNTTVATHNDCGTSTAIVGNGKIGNISSGALALNQTVRVIFSSTTSFTVVSSSGTGCTGGGAQSIGSTAGSTATYSVSNYCSFTITQGSTPFATNDKFFIKSTGNGINCKPGASSNLQPSSPVSLCAEASGVNPSGETWINGGYMSAKGGLGKNSIPSVSWRLATINDYRMAIVNGIIFVLPDTGAPGYERFNTDNSPGGSDEWSSTIYANTRGSAWGISANGSQNTSNRNLNRSVRCVGR